LLSIGFANGKIESYYLTIEVEQDDNEESDEEDNMVSQS
jgi:hypothetical protein